jgi:hypothetical protein
LDEENIMINYLNQQLENKDELLKEW